MDKDQVSWRDIETRVGFGQLPALHRHFLQWRGVAGADELNVRRAQQRVEAELNRLVQAGAAQRVGDDWLISADALAGFEFDGL